VPDPKPSGEPRPFADVLLELSKGRTHREASTALQALIAAVTDVGKAGSLVLTFKITPDKAPGMVRVAADVNAKPPRPDREALFFVDSDHNLTRDDPQQTTLFPPAGDRR